MTAKYPNEEYTPRTLENTPGHPYDENKTDILFAEEVNQANDEIKELEKRLTPFTDTPLPSGVRIGDNDLFYEMADVQVGDVSFPVLKITDSTGEIVLPYAQPSFLPIFKIDEAHPQILFYDPITEEQGVVAYDSDFSHFYCTNSWAILNTSADVYLRLASFAFQEGSQFVANITASHELLRLIMDTDLQINGNLYVDEDIVAEGSINAVEGFKKGEFTGQDGYILNIVGLRWNGTQLQFKDQGTLYRGGLIVRIDEPSEWTVVPSA